MVFAISLLYHCSEPVDFQSSDFESLLVIEGLITDEMKYQSVRATRTVPIDSDEENVVTGATVKVSIDNEVEISFFLNDSTGTYLSEQPFAGEIGKIYQLMVTTADGQQYFSQPVEMLPTPSIDSIYALFEPQPDPLNSGAGNFSFYLATGSDEIPSRFYRWTWTSAFELSVPLPSRFLWTGGNTFISRERGGENDDLQVEICWQMDTSSQILLTQTPTAATTVPQQPLTSFPSSSRAMRRAFGLEVKQYTLSQESFEYWNLIAQISQGQGTLFDRQAGTVVGNIRNVEDSTATILGIFEAAQEVVTTRIFRPLEFTDMGFRRNGSHIVDCEDIEPETTDVDEIGLFMEQNQEAFTLCCFITEPPTAVYVIKRCSDCTQFGQNHPPDFWIN